MNTVCLLACEPVPALFIGWAGSVTAAVLFRTLVALIIVVAAKSLLFALFLRGKFMQAFFWMVVANILSTIPGIIIGATTSTYFALWIGLIVLGFFAIATARFFCANLRHTSWSWLSPPVSW